jgi:hypothetical protein
MCYNYDFYIFFILKSHIVFLAGGLEVDIKKKNIENLRRKAGCRLLIKTTNKYLISSWTAVDISLSLTHVGTDFMVSIYKEDKSPFFC